MLLLPQIPEKPPTFVRRHSIDADFFKRPSIDRQNTVVASKQIHNQNKTNNTFKSVLKTKYSDFDEKIRNEDDEHKTRVNFIVEEKPLKLPFLDQKNITYPDLKSPKARLAHAQLKQNPTLSTTLPMKAGLITKNKLDDKKLKQLGLSEKELREKQIYLAKGRRSSSNIERFHNGSKKQKRRKNKEKMNKNDKNNKKSGKKNDDNDEDEYEYVDEAQQSNEVKEFISLVKRLHISDGQTPHPDVYRERPKQPRLLTNLSTEGQYALMKSYEDTIAKEITLMHPNLSAYVPRVLTSKFRKRVVQPKNLRFLNTSRIDTSNNNNNRDSPFKSMSKQNSFIQQPFPTNSNDPDYIDHQLLVSQQLEIAQEILDIIKKNKGEKVMSKNVDENLDILRTYAAYVKIWTKYFHLR